LQEARENLPFVSKLTGFDRAAAGDQLNTSFQDVPVALIREVCALPTEPAPAILNLSQGFIERVSDVCRLSDVI